VQYVYYSGKTNETGSGDYLKQYSITDGVVSAAPVELTKNLFLVGSTPSSRLMERANGIVWAVDARTPSRRGRVPSLRCFMRTTPTDVSDTLYSSANAAQLRDQPGCANKFVTPTVAQGKVYVWNAE